MLGRFEFHVYLHADHPSADLSHLPQRLGREAVHLSQFGAPRKGVRGQALEGTYSDSRCQIELASDRDGTMAECFEIAADLLLPHADLLSAIREGGGTTSLFARWYPNGDTGEQFSVDLLKKLIILGVEFGFNVYGVEPASR